MILIIGLGNPGLKFKNTRHNLGFRIVEEFAKKNNFPDFKFSRLRPPGFGGQAKKINSLISETNIDNQKIILAKPQTFMNESGQAVKLFTRTYKLEANNLIIVHDDIDLDLGKIKIVKNRGPAGHKGVQSIINALGTKDFIRVRIGIKPINNKQKTINKIENFVLKKFNKEEEKNLKGIIEKAVTAIEFFLKNGLEKTQSIYNMI
jgi:PTH1 family peptidyl-tRNA hydrolase